MERPRRLPGPFACRTSGLVAGGGFYGGGGFLVAAQYGTAAALACGDVVDLVPKADKVVGGRDDGQDGHPIGCGDGD